MGIVTQFVSLLLLATSGASLATDSECEGSCPATGGSSMIHLKQQVKKHFVAESIPSECGTCDGCMWRGSCRDKEKYPEANQIFCAKNNGTWCGDICSMEEVCSNCAQCSWKGDDVLAESYKDLRAAKSTLKGRGHSADDCTRQCLTDNTCKFAALSHTGYCHLFNTCDGSDTRVPWTRWEKKCSSPPKCTIPTHHNMKYLGDMTDPCKHPYVYTDRDAANEACASVGLELCAKADIHGWEHCAAGWLSDGKGYYVNDASLKGPCGSGIGYQNWVGQTAGAYCCPKSDDQKPADQQVGIKGLKSGDKVHLVNIDHGASVGTCGIWGASNNGCAPAGAKHDIHGYQGRNLERGIYEVNKTAGSGPIRHGDEVIFYQRMHGTYLGLCGVNCKCAEGIHCAYGFSDGSLPRVKWVVEETDGFIYLKNPSHGTYLCMCGHATRDCDSSNFGVLGCQGKPNRARFQLEPVL